MPGLNLISPAQLARLPGTPDDPAIIDVRPAAGMTAVIPGARRVPFDRFDPAAHDGQRAVVCCKRGKTLSEGVAALLRARGTDRHDLAPQAAGLLALSVGLSRLYRDDFGQLDAGMALHDALYRRARDGFDEGHDWPAARKE